MTWQHGALIAIVYGVCAVLAGVLAFGIPIILLGALLGLESRTLTGAALLLSIIWLPFCIGWMARWTSSDRLKPEGYDELLSAERAERRLDTARKYRGGTLGRR